ncbi:MAG: GyrI-like domain-containing protein [Kibdelosporangium sp.]
MQRPTDGVLSVPLSTPAGQIATAIGAAIGKLLTRAADAGLQPGGPPEVTYLTEFDPDSDAPAEIEVDLPVIGPVEGISGARQRTACVMARTVHRGPYDQLGRAHEALAGWVAANGYQVTGPPTEVYLLGPDKNRDPSEYLTEIALPVTR